MAEKVKHYLAYIGVCQLTEAGTRIDRGIIFVRNKKDFKRLVRNKYKFGTTRFNNFTYMHIIPEKAEGVDFLYLLNHMQDLTYSVIQHIIAGGEYQYNQMNRYAIYFLLEDVFGTMVYYGVDMNYNTLAEVYYESQNAEIDFSILCLDWQEEYYRSLFGDDREYIILNTGFIKGLCAKQNINQQ